LQLVLIFFEQQILNRRWKQWRYNTKYTEFDFWLVSSLLYAVRLVFSKDLYKQ
jgi:hypothetical protein